MEPNVEKKINFPLQKTSLSLMKNRNQKRKKRNANY
jgi:hypothetical protein